MKDELKKLFKPRSEQVHKHQCGRIGVIAGSEKYKGAAILAAKAAFRLGIGMVYAFTNSVTESAILNHLPECIVLEGLEKGADQLLTQIHQYKIDVLLIGPGLGQSKPTKQGLEQLLASLPKTLPMIWDADALTQLDPSLFSRFKKNNMILTPHEGEYKNMFKLTDFDQKKRSKYALKGAQISHQILVLKGHETVVSNGQDHYINQTGNSGMAVAGSGDVLAGILAALLVESNHVYDVAKGGVYLHGLIGDECEKRYNRGLIPSDMIEILPTIIKPYVS